MTPAERFAAWLKPAMRNAGLDVDRQQGGGRAALAKACDVSRSTVGRWLDGQSLPAASHFKPIADTLNLPVADVLVAGGIISQDDLDAPPVTLNTEESIAALAVRWGIPEENMPMFRASVEALATGFAAGRKPEETPKRRRTVRRPTASE
ncbi:helix-turn-helix transcriptional regulator [Streptomyces sp. CB03911]|uniref:helix-turn-helix domain-containing protein n=1 Tax=Streptomyces sp. CB03911 TaxID=1804758 RepID=UPI00093CB013|nr:helix-turn-helix transcriptional regulator [Streptomyces sp. CB03911]OKI16602.1 hypothetical protein A6A07_11380 [Streptomyces sp. CB03911]